MVFHIPVTMKDVTVTTILCLWVLAGAEVEGREGFGSGAQEFGYATVRSEAHLFYWLYYVDSDAVRNPAERPIVVWLEGGPGAAASSYGNFGKLGPLDPAAQPRNTSWVARVNLLFVDSPVGTGYSYVDKAAALARTNKQASLDLVELTRQFVDKYPQFRTTPWYIFGESYGGSVAAEYALCLQQEIKAGRLSVNLKGVVMADAWLSGVDHVESWAPYLYHLGMVDSRGRAQLADAAARVRAAAESEQWQSATSLWSAAWGLMTNLTEGVNIYNVLAPIKDDGKKGGKPAVPCASPEMMNGEVHRALAIPDSVVHRNDNSQVFSAQYEQFMKPITETVEKLLSDAGISVTLYGGQLDLFTNLAGTNSWVDRLKWSSADAFRSAKRTSLVVDGVVAGYLKQGGGLATISVNRAGHMVATDYPAAAAEIVRFVTKCEDPPARCN